jgi:chromosomal replication initiator protein
VDVLLMDDVQFLMGKNGVQFELFNTFNELMDRGKQMVFCSDRSPDNLTDFQDRLVSRFKMGIVTEMEMPDVETRKKIARKIVETEGGKLREEVLDFLAENIDGSLRELRGAIIKLIAYQEIEGKEVSVYDAMGIVGNLLRSERGVDPSEKHLATLAVIFDVSPSEIKGKTRKASAVLARQLGMYFAKKYLKMSNC